MQLYSCHMFCLSALNCFSFFAYSTCMISRIHILSNLVSHYLLKVLLLCCPRLKHINLSCCKRITDKAFVQTIGYQAVHYDSKCDTCQFKASYLPIQAGKSLTSVDLSGCQSLTTNAIRNLVELCGPSLVSVSFAWTSIGCIGLLFLAGLDTATVDRCCTLTWLHNGFDDTNELITIIVI